MIVRVFDGVAKHFPARRSEWMGAVMMFGWGRFVANDGDLFDKAVAYQHMARMADEATWAYWATAIGLIRLAALLINGSFHDRWYSKYSPHVRGVMSFFACFLWCQLSLGLFGSGTLPPALAIYPVLAVNDLLNVFSAARDAGKSVKAAANEPN
ncbi:MAG: hypothetical protein DI527_00845 [Chelatococcus sp.]|nr:MAG: hypothetical protein DI527_00845 [Chelatococcus sp.]